jgi:dipeptidase D
MATRVEDLQPQALWHYFLELSKVPRGSKKEGAAIDWIEKVAREHGVEAVRDSVNNILVRVPASQGHEKAPVVLLQSHVDMVCEKNADVTHDFERDPIRMAIDGEWVRGQGTTLGADNGIGVAAALAFLDEKKSVHGPLELLFTIDEETGLTGASGIQPGYFRARAMINLDSEEIGVFTVGCAGGRDTTVTLRAPRAVRPGAALARIAVTGLTGGHSGTDIHKNRGNSIKILARLLLAAAEDAAVGPLAVGAMAGGSKRNALPREAWAVVAVDAGREGALRAAIEKEAAHLRAQVAGIEEKMQVAVETLPATGDARPVADPAASLRLIRLLNALPHGVLGMNVDIPDLVETSSNVGVMTDLNDGWLIANSSRSSVGPALLGVLAQVRSAARLAGAEAVHSDGYPGWKPNMKSPLLARARGVHQRLFGKEAEVRAIHAGLECGLLTEKYPELDMISYGPDIQGAHSPDERVRIPTVAKMWDFTVALLEDMTRG